MTTKVKGCKPVVANGEFFGCCRDVVSRDLGGWRAKKGSTYWDVVWAGESQLDRSACCNVSLTSCFPTGS